MAGTSFWRRGGFAAALRVLPLAACLLVASVAARASEKAALIIGNSHYKNAAPLSTPVNDADDLGAAVTSLGFEVTVLKDATGAQLRDAIQKFAERSAKLDFSIVYYGGHSVELGGEQYLIPVDTKITAESQIRTEGIPLRSLTLTVARARALGLVVFDALRPNTILANAVKDATREAPIDLTGDGFRNVVHFFAAETGKSALPGTVVEGQGRNSPLTAGLLKFIHEPNMEINFYFRNVRDEVRRATLNRQTPFMYGQLSRTKFYINGTAEVAAARAVARDPAAVHPCDTMAAAPEDATRAKAVKGVRLEDIKPAEAIAACQEAMKLFPGIGRFPYQLGRAAFAAKDYEAAIGHYSRAFELGSELAMMALATMYDGGVGARKDPARARFYYEVGVAKKSAPAMVALGMQYERGAGVPVDLKKAYEFYKSAADLGHARAFYNVGLFAEKGIVVPQNAALAREMYEKSATKGDDIAMLNLARLYANGIGGKKDMSKAKDWLTTAEQAGNAQAKQILANLNKPPPKR